MANRKRIVAYHGGRGGRGGRVVRRGTATRFLRAVCVILAGIVHLSAQTTSWRPTVVAQHGMVAAGHPLAAEAGMRILKAGGNAVDAAMATWAVQGEVEPGMTGLGADMFVLVYLAKTGEVKLLGFGHVCDVFVRQVGSSNIRRRKSSADKKSELSCCAEPK